MHYILKPLVVIKRSLLHLELVFNEWNVLVAVIPDERALIHAVFRPVEVVVEGLKNYMSGVLLKWGSGVLYFEFWQAIPKLKYVIILISDWVIEGRLIKGCVMIILGFIYEFLDGLVLENTPSCLYSC